MPSSVPGSAGYGAHAATLAVQYESLRFDDVHREVLHLFPQPPARVLDIGAGTGRDAAALARRGHAVVAVEPTPELRSEGLRLHGGLDIEWIDDHLPALASLRGARRQFDLVLLTAVWMHLDGPEREAAMAALADLVADGGLVSLSLRHGPVPAGRRMFDVSAEETAALGARHGLSRHFCSRREDMLGRSSVDWTFLVLRKAAA